MKTEIKNIHQRVIFVVVLWQSLSLYFIVVNHYLSGYGFHHKNLPPTRTATKTYVLHVPWYITVSSAQRFMVAGICTVLNNRPPYFLDPLHINIAYFRSQ